MFVWSTSLPPIPHNEAPHPPNILPGSRVGVLPPPPPTHFRSHLKALVWSLTKDNARCSMLTKAPSSLVTRRKEEETRSLIMSKRSSGSGPRWSGEWSGLMSRRKYSTIIIMPWEAGPGIILKGREKKAVSCFERRVAVRERQKEARSRGEVGGAQYRQEIPAEKVGPRPNYTALCQRLCTNAHEHACTLTNTHRHWFVLQLTLNEPPIGGYGDRRAALDSKQKRSSLRKKNPKKRLLIHYGKCCARG